MSSERRHRCVNLRLRPSRPCPSANTAMSNPWDAEVECDESLVRTLIESQFPELAPVAAAPLASGWDNTAWLVNAEFVFRFPRRQLGADCLNTELDVLPDIASRISLPVTSPTFIGTPAHGFPWRFGGYRMIPGRPAGECGLSPDERARLAGPIAGFLRELHDIPIDEVEALGIPGDAFRRFDFEHRRVGLLQRLSAAAEHGHTPADVAWGERLVDAASSIPIPETRHVLHGDFYSRHLLVDEQSQLTGIIDWGDLHLGCRAVDLMIVFAFLPPEARPSFFETYGPVDEDLVSLARFRALDHTLFGLEYAVKTGSGTSLSETRTNLESVRSADVG